MVPPFIQRINEWTEANSGRLPLIEEEIQAPDDWINRYINDLESRPHNPIHDRVTIQV